MALGSSKAIILAFIPERKSNCKLVSSEKETIKFTINVKTRIGSYVSQRGSDEFKVVRSYTDFSWLHSSLSENDLYSGLLIPPKPYKPDFEPSR